MPLGLNEVAKSLAVSVSELGSLGLQMGQIHNQRDK